MTRRSLLTGLRPTNNLHIGNYFGALAPVLEYQNIYDSRLMIADLHALTTLTDSKNISRDTIEIAAWYLAAGVNPKKTTIFLQSYIPEHCELATLLSMISPISMLELNPVYKEMIQDNPKATNLGLLSYPVLQAADILSHEAEFVPVGKDQLPHIELARELVRRFNARFKKTFKEPKALIERELKILSLKDPTKKMSKSHSDDSQISLTDSPNHITKKIISAVTDSGSDIRYSPEDKPALSNLILIMSLVSNKDIRSIERSFHSSGYKEFKVALTDSIIRFLRPLQDKYRETIKSKKTISKILSEGSQQAKKKAVQTLEKARLAIRLFT